MLKRLIYKTGNAILELLDDKETENSNSHNANRTEMRGCRFCQRILREDLLYEHETACRRHRLNRTGVPHRHINVQHRPHSSPSPPVLPPRIPRPPSVPPRRSIRSPSQNSTTSVTSSIPDALLCPITSCIFEDPVLAEDGHTYEKRAIIQWIRQDGRSPITRQPIREANLRPNYTIRNLVDELRLKNSLGS